MHNQDLDDMNSNASSMADTWHMQDHWYDDANYASTGAGFERVMVIMGPPLDTFLRLNSGARWAIMRPSEARKHGAYAPL